MLLNGTGARMLESGTRMHETGAAPFAAAAMKR
jgi:hypothetical protein